MNPSPRPWKSDLLVCKDGSKHVCIFTEEELKKAPDEVVAVCAISEIGAMNEQDVANTKFILRAANCHDELVAKLENAVHFIPNIDERARIQELLKFARGES
jgi:hypothetical protein